ncbi:2785_t:CDS:10 [Diversispora eburnea]|uniref:2785_t:CDS:1 n=1 Tax=Diversispora eburnea TaxID=1213867 RepID=A0A9N8Z3R6_9GLOM|nr:2785_t:CDS:10 [Diversispora eburnea]
MELNNGDINSRPIILKCLHWSEDNQISVVSPPGVYIFTPLYKGRDIRGNGTCIRSAIVSYFSAKLMKGYPETFRCFTWSPLDPSSSARWIEIGHDQFTGSDDGSVCLWKVILTLFRVISSGIESVKTDISVSLYMKLSDEDRRVATIIKWYYETKEDYCSRLAIAKGLKIYERKSLLNIEHERPKTFMLPLSKGIVGINWNYDGKQLNVFLNEGNHITLTIPENNSGDENDNINESGNGLFSAVVFMLESPDDQYITDKFEFSYTTFVPIEEQRNKDLASSLVKIFKDRLEDGYLLDRMSITYLLWDVLEYCNLENEYEVKNSLFYQLVQACWDFYYQHKTTTTTISVNLISLNDNMTKVLVYLYSNTAKFRKELEPSFTDCLKKIEQHFLSQLLSIIVQCIQNGVSSNEALDQSFIIHWCDWILKYFPEDNNLIKLAKFCYEYLSSLDETCRIYGNLESEKELISSIMESSPSSSSSMMMITTTTTNKSTKKVNLPSRDLCPACICNKGHIWDLCSLTLNIISNKYVRSCSLCNRKTITISHLFNNEPTIFVKAIFAACEKCLYCGSSFIFRC